MWYGNATIFSLVIGAIFNPFLNIIANERVANYVRIIWCLFTLGTLVYAIINIFSLRYT